MPKSYVPASTTEWYYPVMAEEIDSNPKSFAFSATEQQRADLSRRFGITSIEDAQASITVQRAPGGLIHAMGFVRADITQACVVSLVPIKNHVEEEFEGWYGDKQKTVSFAKARHEREALKNHTEAEILEESEDPEPILDGRIDIGELAAQYLSLAIDPYPHAEGVAREYLSEGQNKATDEGAASRKNPFEALKDWKEKR